MNNAVAGRPTAPVREIVRIDHAGYFSEAATAYQRAASDYAEALEDAAQWADTANDIKARMRDVEAEAIVNGMAEGKNERERDAALRTYLAGLTVYRAATTELRQADLRKSRADNLAHVAANEMSVQRRRMDAHIAWVQRAAAIEANAGTERTDPR